MIAWIIAGSMFRYGAAGKFASGDIVPAGTSEYDWEWALEHNKGLYQT